MKAVRSGPIARMCCTTVRVIRASGLRCNEFRDIIQIRNEKSWFNGPAGKVEHVPELELLCDVDTRWDSTFAMINRLRALRPVSNSARSHRYIIHSSTLSDQLLPLTSQLERARETQVI